MMSKVHSIVKLYYMNSKFVKWINRCSYTLFTIYREIFDVVKLLKILS